MVKFQKQVQSIPLTSALVENEYLAIIKIKIVYCFLKEFQKLDNVYNYSKKGTFDKTASFKLQLSIYEAP